MRPPRWIPIRNPNLSLQCYAHEDGSDVSNIQLDNTLGAKNQSIIQFKSIGECLLPNSNEVSRSIEGVLGAGICYYPGSSLRLHIISPTFHMIILVYRGCITALSREACSFSHRHSSGPQDVPD